VPSALTPQDRSSFYNAAVLGLRALDARERAPRRFGADANARWVQFAGALGACDRLDILRTACAALDAWTGCPLPLLLGRLAPLCAAVGCASRWRREPRGHAATRAGYSSSSSSIRRSARRRAFGSAPERRSASAASSSAATGSATRCSSSAAPRCGPLRSTAFPELSTSLSARDSATGASLSASALGADHRAGTRARDPPARGKPQADAGVVCLEVCCARRRRDRESRESSRELTLLDLRQRRHRLALFGPIGLTAHRPPPSV
jgi:hypothetical protein